MRKLQQFIIRLRLRFARAERRDLVADLVWHDRKIAKLERQLRKLRPAPKRTAKVIPFPSVAALTFKKFNVTPKEAAR